MKHRNGIKQFLGKSLQYMKIVLCCVMIVTLKLRCDYSHGTRRLRSTPPLAETL